MFNGIIYNTGLVSHINKNKKSIYVGIRTKIGFQKKDIGSSVSCDGVCLTIEKIFKDTVYFYISNETLKRSNFKYLKINQTINLEKSLVFGQYISGHFTQGHVDTVARVEKISFIEKTWLLKFRLLDNKMNKYLLETFNLHRER